MMEEADRQQRLKDLEGVKAMAGDPQLAHLLMLLPFRVIRNVLRERSSWKDADPTGRAGIDLQHRASQLSERTETPRGTQEGGNHVTALQYRQRSVGKANSGGIHEKGQRQARIRPAHCSSVVGRRACAHSYISDRVHSGCAGKVYDARSQ